MFETSGTSDGVFDGGFGAVGQRRQRIPTTTSNNLSRIDGTSRFSSVIDRRLPEDKVSESGTLENGDPLLLADVHFLIRVDPVGDEDIRLRLGRRRRAAGFANDHFAVKDLTQLRFS